MNKTELPVSLLLTVRARITNFSPDPNLGNCLEAGSEVDIVCENIAFPVGRVEFVKDGSPVDLSTERCVCVCVRVGSCMWVHVKDVKDGSPVDLSTERCVCVCVRVGSCVWVHACVYKNNS